MTESNFVVLLARQRSGTNALRSIMESHPEIFCFNEVFSFNDHASEDAALRAPNFFTFVTEYARDDMRRVMPDQHERMFLDFLEYLRCFSDERYLVVDVKCNTSHFFTKPFSDDMTRPYLFDLIRAHDLRVLHVTRKNYLRYVLSVMKAWRSRSYAVSTRDGRSHSDSSIRLDVGFLLRTLDICHDEDSVIERTFGSYPRLLSYDYAELFPGGTDPVAGAFLEELSRWLGVADTFRTETEFQKQSSLPLAETIENFDEVAAALRGTRYEHCLDDERAYARTPLPRTARGTRMRSPR